MLSQFPRFWRQVAVTAEEYKVTFIWCAHLIEFPSPGKLNIKFKEGDNGGGRGPLTADKLTSTEEAA